MLEVFIALPVFVFLIAIIVLVMNRKRLKRASNKKNHITPSCH